MADHAREVAFTRAFFRNLDKIEEKIRRRTAIRQTIQHHQNNVAEAWRHLKPGEPSSGFMQLAENGLLHLSIEALGNTSGSMARSEKSLSWSAVRRSR